MNRTQHLLSSLESRLARCDASGLWQRLRACCGVPSLASGVARVRAVMPHAAAAGASMPLPVAVGAGGGGCCWRARRVPCCMPRACRHAACVHACKPSAWGRAGVRVHASSPRAPTALASCRRRLRAWAWHDAAYGRAGRVLRVCIDRSVRSCMASDFRFKWVMRLEAKSVQPWRRPALARLV